MRLWVGRIKMGEKVNITKVLKAGSVVSHHVAGAGQEIVARDVTVVALVITLEAQKVRCWADGSSGAFARPEQRGGVVSAAKDGAFTNVKVLNSALVLDEVAGEFKVGVGDRAFGIFPGDESGNGRFGKIHAPNDRRRW